MSASITLYQPLDVKCLGVTEDCYYFLWDDDKEHEHIDLTYLKKFYGHDRNFRRILNNLKGINWQISWDRIWGIEKVVPVEKKRYMQGCFFKNSLLNRKSPIYYTCNKQNMVKFLQKNLTKGNSNIIHTFEDAWEDGMIFEFIF